MSAGFLFHNHSLSMLFMPGNLPDAGDTRPEERECPLFRCQILNHKLNMALKNLRIK